MWTLHNIITITPCNPLYIFVEHLHAAWGRTEQSTFKSMKLSTSPSTFDWSRTLKQSVIGQRSGSTIRWSRTDRSDGSMEGKQIPRGQKDRHLRAQCPSSCPSSDGHFEEIAGRGLLELSSLTRAEHGATPVLISIQLCELLWHLQLAKNMLVFQTNPAKFVEKEPFGHGSKEKM